MTEKKGLCVSLGKCAGSSYRTFSETLSKAAGILKDSARAFGAESKMLCARTENLYQKVRTHSQLARLQMRQKDHFARLGEALFTNKKDKLKRVFNDKEIKKVITDIRDEQSNIAKIEAEMHAQNLRMKHWAFYRHALMQLNNPRPRIRLVALKLLEKLKFKDSIPQIARLLKDPDPLVAERARTVIRNLRRNSEVPVIPVQPPFEAKPDLRPSAKLA